MAPTKALLCPAEALSSPALLESGLYMPDLTAWCQVQTSVMEPRARAPGRQQSVWCAAGTLAGWGTEGSLWNLTGLYLRNTGLTGTLPSWTSSTLQYVDLAIHQGLDGHCPGPAGGLTGIQGLGFRVAGQQYLKADLGLLLYLLSSVSSSYCQGCIIIAWAVPRGA